MGILDRFKTKKGEEKVSMPGKSVQEEKPDVAAKEEKAAKPAKAKTAKKEAKPAKQLPAGLENIVVRPLVTEKAAHLASVGQYAFIVSTDASRVQVRNAVKAMYGVLPERVNIQVVRGKAVRFGRKTGMRKSWKKAIVVLPKGKTIDVHEGV